MSSRVGAMKAKATAMRTIDQNHRHRAKERREADMAPPATIVASSPSPGTRLP
jgi:flagellar biosynthesis/type III secretory pathway chaperone